MKKGSRIKKRIYTLLILAAIVLAALLLYGGEGFRWFGEKTENIGESIREHSEELGEKADEFKEGVEKKAGDIKKGVNKKTDEIKQDVADTVTGKEGNEK